MIPFDNYAKSFRWNILVSKGNIEKALIDLKRSSEIILGLINAYGGILISENGMDILNPQEYSDKRFTLPLKIFDPKEFTLDGYTVYWFLNKGDLLDFYKAKNKASLKKIKPKKEVTQVKVSRDLSISVQYTNALIIKTEDDRL